MDHNKLWKICKEIGIPNNLTCPLRNQNACQECRVQFSSVSRVRLFAAPWTAGRQASLSITYSWSLLSMSRMQSTLCKMLGWMNHKPGEIQEIQDCQEKYQ